MYPGFARGLGWRGRRMKGGQPLAPATARLFIAGTIPHAVLDQRTPPVAWAPPPGGGGLFFVPPHSTHREVALTGCHELFKCYPSRFIIRFYL